MLWKHRWTNVTIFFQGISTNIDIWIIISSIVGKATLFMGLNIYLEHLSSQMWKGRWRMFSKLPWGEKGIFLLTNGNVWPMTIQSREGVFRKHWELSVHTLGGQKSSISGRRNVSTKTLNLPAHVCWSLLFHISHLQIPRLDLTTQFWP